MMERKKRQRERVRRTRTSDQARQNAGVKMRAGDGGGSKGAAVLQHKSKEMNERRRRNKEEDQWKDDEDAKVKEDKEEGTIYILFISLVLCPSIFVACSLGCHVHWVSAGYRGVFGGKVFGQVEDDAASLVRFSFHFYLFSSLTSILFLILLYLILPCVCPYIHETNLTIIVEDTSLSVYSLVLSSHFVARYTVYICSRRSSNPPPTRELVNYFAQRDIIGPRLFG